jgi:hypothetical protein
MQGKYKRFDKALFEENDKKAREIAKRYFSKPGYIAQDNPYKYGADLAVYDTTMCSTILYIETEIKRVWKTDDFPWDTIQFPERKAKYIQQAKPVPVVYFMLNKECTSALIVKGQDLIDSPLVEVSNKEIKSGELFYQVPFEKARQVQIRK